MTDPDPTATATATTADATASVDPTADATATAGPIPLAVTLRPQFFGRQRPDKILQPVVEPRWRGLRVIVAATAETVTIHDEDGTPVTDHALIAARLTRMIAHTADGVILDGYLTKQSPAAEVPVPLDMDEVPTTAQMATKPFLGIRRGGTEDRIKRLDAEEEDRTFTDDDIVNFVATDLLWLDGEWLLDVPLLERKRLLEAVIRGDDLVRTGPYVLPPYQSWIGSWRAQGFAAITFKEANSRYRPGEIATDWALSDLPRR